MPRAYLIFVLLLSSNVSASGWPIFDGANLGGKLLEQSSAAANAVQVMLAQELDRTARTNMNNTEIGVIEGAASERIARETEVGASHYNLKLESSSVPATDACRIYTQTKIGGASSRSEVAVSSKRSDFQFLGASELLTNMFQLMTQLESASSHKQRVELRSELKLLQAEGIKELTAEYILAIKHIEQSALIAKESGPQSTYSAKTYLASHYPDWFVDRIEVYESAISTPRGYFSVSGGGNAVVEDSGKKRSRMLTELAQQDVISMSRELISSTRLLTTGERISLREYQWITGEDSFSRAAADYWNWLSSGASTASDGSVAVTRELGLQISMKSGLIIPKRISGVLGKGLGDGPSGSNAWRQMVLLKSVQALKDSVSFEYEQASLLLAAVRLSVEP